MQFHLQDLHGIYLTKEPKVHKRSDEKAKKYNQSLTRDERCRKDKEMIPEHDSLSTLHDELPFTERVQGLVQSIHLFQLLIEHLE